eukprot:g4873.t1
MYGLERFQRLKFMIIVKNPVDRLVSWYNHHIETGLISKKRVTSVGLGDLELAAVRAMENKLMVRSGKYLNLDKEENACLSNNACFDSSNFLLLSLYGKWLKMWLDAGARPEQFKVVFLNELKTSPVQTINGLTDFLGLKRAMKTAKKVKEINRHVFNRHEHKSIFKADVRKQLTRWFEPGNCYFAWLLSTTKIRKWRDSVVAADNWIPTQRECREYIERVFEGGGDVSIDELASLRSVNEDRSAGDARDGAGGVSSTKKRVFQGGGNVRIDRSTTTKTTIGNFEHLRFWFLMALAGFVFFALVYPLRKKREKIFCSPTSG